MSNPTPPTFPERIDEAITNNVNRGLIHEDRWDDLKAALLQAVEELMLGVISDNEEITDIKSELLLARISSRNDLRAVQRTNLTAALGRNEE